MTLSQGLNPPGVTQARKRARGGEGCVEGRGENQKCVRLMSDCKIKGLRQKRIQVI